MTNGPTSPTCCRLPECGGPIRDAQGVCAAETIESICGESADWSDRFIAAIKHDTRHSRIRRGHIHNPPEKGVGAEAEIYRRLELFKQTGKRDYLIDVAKFSMILWADLNETDLPRGAFN